MVSRVSKKCAAVAASLLVGAVALAGAPRAEAAEWLGGSLTGSIALYSDYVFRGVSQTDENWAPQYGLDWEHDSGFFMGVWGSRLDYAPADRGAFMEQDFIVGFRQSLDNLSWDVSATYFWYPDSDGALNYEEYGANFGYDFGFASWSLGGLYSPDYFGGGLGKAYYLQTGLAIPLPIQSNGLSFTLDGSFGYTNTQETFDDDDEYQNWSVGLVIDIDGGLSIDLRYHDTDIEDENLADRRFVAGISYGF